MAAGADENWHKATTQTPGRRTFHSHTHAANHNISTLRLLHCQQCLEIRMQCLTQDTPASPTSRTRKLASTSYLQLTARSVVVEP